MTRVLVVLAAVVALLSAMTSPVVAVDPSPTGLPTATTTVDATYDEVPNLAATMVAGTTRLSAVERGVSDALGAPLASSRELSAPRPTGGFPNHGGEFLGDALRSPVVRPDFGNMSSKIQRQMGQRGWTPDLIDEAVLGGDAFPAVNKLGGAFTPATRYVHPRTGQSVVIDNATGEIVQVGGPGFRFD